MKDAKESARQVRRVLKYQWPNCKFSVRSKHFAGGSAVDVRWTDGPTEREVTRATAHLKKVRNGYWNEYINTSRRTSREVMVAAARAAADYYEVAMPEVAGGEDPYVTNVARVRGFTDADREEALCDKVHRAVWRTSVYDVELDAAFAEAYPIN